MKLPTIALSLLLALGSSAYAGDKTQCSCDKQCQENCAQGKGEKCQCKTCDCSKSGKCEHGKCTHKADGQQAPKGE